MLTHPTALTSGRTSAERIRMALIGRPNPQKTIVCPYCNKVGGYSGMKRYHFDNCPKEVQDYLEKSVLLQ